ncbi:MAG: hypothetical protein ABH842_02125 [Candidatus Micrarchaeota archaeon]
MSERCNCCGSSIPSVVVKAHFNSSISGSGSGDGWICVKCLFNSR